MRFDSNALDLLQTYRRYREKFGKDPYLGGSFGLQVVTTADGLLGGHGPEPGEVEGIRKCLTFQTLRLRRRGAFRRLLLLDDERVFVSDAFGYSARDRENATLIVDSLMLTVTKYRRQLREYHSNMAQIVLAEVCAGFELLCGWVMRGVPVSPSENELAVQLNVLEIERDLRLPNKPLQPTSGGPVGIE